MIYKNEIWALVTARKNSKSIKRKNLVKLNNKMLVNYSFNVLKNCKSINKIIVSTDDILIDSIAKKLKFEVIKRPRKLAGDLVNSVDVIYDVLNKSFNKYGYLPKWFVLIQPTSIFLQLEDLNKLINSIEKNLKIKSAQTIVRVPHQFHAFNQRYFDGKFTGFIFEKERMKQHNKQTKSKNYAHGNLIATKSKFFIKEKSFFCKPSLGIEISKIRSFDLDNQEDLILARQIIKRKIKYYEI